MISSLPRRVRTVAALAFLLAAAPVDAQARQERMPVPFGVGERLDYDVRFGRLSVGSGSMEVAELENIRGRETWHTVLRIRGGTFFYRIDDTYESWFDTRTGNSLRYRQDQKQGRRVAERLYEIFPERSEYTENGGPTHESVREPLDEGSFLYFIRTTPLVVGQTYVFERFYRLDRNPVIIKVLRRERVRVPAGEFDAIVVQPIIKSSSIFGENGHAEVWLSDDKNRIMLQMKSGLSFGSINLYLKSYRPAQAGATATIP